MCGNVYNEFQKGVGPNFKKKRIVKNCLIAISIHQLFNSIQFNSIQFMAQISKIAIQFKFNSSAIKKMAN